MPSRDRLGLVGSNREWRSACRLSSRHLTHDVGKTPFPELRQFGGDGHRLIANRMQKGQLPGVQANAIAECADRAVTGIAKYRLAAMGQLSANLVTTACLRAKFKPGQAAMFT